MLNMKTAYLSSSVDHGVSIGWLHEFAVENNLWDVPTWKVCRSIILPACEASRCRYIDLPEVIKTGAVGRASTYVSHSWQAPFGDLVAGLCEAADLSRRIFIDIFCANQWIEPSVDVDNSMRIVRECSSFVVVCSTSQSSHIDATRSANTPLLVGTHDEGKDRTGSLISQYATSIQSSELQDDYTCLFNSVLISRSPFFALNQLWCLVEMLVACVSSDNVAFIVKCGQHAFHKKNNHPYFIHDSTAVFEVSNGIDLTHACARSDSIVSILLEYVTVTCALPIDTANDKLRRAVTAALSCIDSSTVQAAACGDKMAGFHIVTNAFDVLVAATVSGYTKVIQMIVDDGYDLKQAKTHHTKNHALIEAANNDRLSCLELLLINGFPVDCPNREGSTALVAAAVAGNKRCVDMLLSQGADLNHRDSEGINALMAVVLNNQFESMEYLISKGADPCEVNSTGVTVLMCAMSGAVMSGDLRCVQYLVQQCNCESQINAKDSAGGCCALIVACALECLKYFVSVGGDVNVQEESGERHTPLMKACQQGEVGCVQFLIDCGADATCVDAAGRTCLTIAKRSKSLLKNECIRLVSDTLKRNTKNII